MANDTTPQLPLLLKSSDIVAEGWVSSRARINQLINKNAFPFPDTRIGGLNMWKRESLNQYFFGEESPHARRAKRQEVA